MATSASTIKKKIAIIGGGSGLTTAWALDQQDEFDVTLFEAKPWLGGDAHSIKFDGVPLETGTEFFPGQAFYPNVHRLFKHLGVKLEPFQLTIDFHDLTNDDHTILPPVYYTSGSTPGCLPCLSFLRKDHAQPETRIALDTILTDLLDLVKINHAIERAKEDLTPDDEVMTLAEFLEDVSFCGCEDDFAKYFLYPLTGAGWGVHPDRIKDFVPIMQ